MIFISATRLRLKSLIYLPKFIISNELSVKRLKKTPGFFYRRELIEKNLTFWTLTMWNTETDMKVFRNSMPHRKAMQKLPIWCDESAFVHWMQEDQQPPNWKIVYEKILSEGRISNVRNPSQYHLSKNYPTIKWTKLERNFKPVGKN